MPTLYVENVPEDLYEAIRTRARKDRKSISAEVLEVLSQNFPTAAELKRRKDFLRFARKMSSQEPLVAGPFPSTEEMIREDRER